MWKTSLWERQKHLLVFEWFFKVFPSPVFYGHIKVWFNSSGHENAAGDETIRGKVTSLADENRLFVNMAHHGINSHLTEVLNLEERAAFISGDHLCEAAAQCSPCSASATSPCKFAYSHSKHPHLRGFPPGAPLFPKKDEKRVELDFQSVPSAECNDEDLGWSHSRCTAATHQPSEEAPTLGAPKYLLLLSSFIKIE